ncbi:putative disease resistance protein RGA1 [Senna tora]|uniref:Putative disease resistance protein RGA1 n=1 Tax=Senna tora TaxID=362788 RepID=A0A834WDX2_9FABA|nr:putative disease resistance protein RGA1 [Senna tora]
MAEALLGVVLENLSSFARDELATFWGVNGEIQRLTNSLKLIQAVIVDAEQKEITQESIKIWLQQLKDAAHVLDDMLDEYSIRSLPHNFGSTSQAHRFSLSSIKPNNLRCRYRIGKRLKEITQRLDQISQDGNKYCFVQRQVIRERPIDVLEWRQTSSIIPQPQIYGIDEGLANLRYLRHFIILECPAISWMPPSIGKLSGLRTLSLFIVRSEEGHSLKELHDLNLCQRELSIKGLKCVGSVDEAKGVNLIGIKELRVLSLSWDNSEESEIKAVGVDAEQVIEALQPFSNLNKLEVRGYKGSCFPSWIKDDSCLNNLVSLNLQDCSNCVQLPALGKLPSLETLCIVNMACVEYLDDDECYDDVEVKAFRSLKTLELYSMPKLERLLKREGGEMFPHLHDLYISGCPKLTLSCLPSVEELVLGYSKEELVKSISNLHGLKSLQIFFCSKLKKLPTQLKSLHALESLDLMFYDELECIPEQVMEGLCSLRSLTIQGCSGLKCLPEAIQHLTSLEYLNITDCPMLEERCKKGSGEDWHKIQHIPNISIS